MKTLVSPYGLVSHTARLPVADGEPRFAVYSASVGNLGPVLDAHPQWTHDPAMGNVDGAGGDIEPERATFLAIAEAVERHASCAWRADRMFWATANELGEDLLRWPHCSPAELARPECALVAPDPDAPMRWVAGWSLLDNRQVHVPATLVWLKNTPQSRGERFAHSVSTGCAVHTDLTNAIIGGILEVVERDAITLTWLHRLRLPRLEFDTNAFGAAQRAAIERADVEHIRSLVFDATTDLGIPVVYGLQLADHDRALAQLVAATCDPDPGRAVAKLFREKAAVRVALRTMTGQSTRAFASEAISVVAGALAMGHIDRRDRFDFLTSGERPTRRVEDLSRPPSLDPPVVLRWLLERLRSAGCEVIVVDITTDEARQAGAVAVRVLIPQLMPLSFDRFGRYLAHPRLYAAPVRMGHPARTEHELNSDPQPFA